MTPSSCLPAARCATPAQGQRRRPPLATAHAPEPAPDKAPVDAAAPAPVKAPAPAAAAAAADTPAPAPIVTPRRAPSPSHDVPRHASAMAAPKKEPGSPLRHASSTACVDATELDAPELDATKLDAPELDDDYAGHALDAARDDALDADRDDALDAARDGRRAADASSALMPARPALSLTGDSAARRQRRRRHLDGPHPRCPTRSLAAHGAAPPQNATPLSTPPPASPLAASFSFFSSSMSAIKSLASSSSPAAPASHSPAELVALDVEAALFPAAALSPAAKALHDKALALLRAFQSACHDQNVALEALRAEREAYDDERSGLETRASHLRMQLHDMAQKAAETEAVVHALVDELAREKRLRLEEHHARRLASSSASVSEDLARGLVSSSASVSEDLGAEEDQRRRDRRRRSAATAKTDVSSDTDEESVDEASVFSRCRSPTPATAAPAPPPAPLPPSASMPPPPVPHQPKRASLRLPAAPRQPPPQLSTLQRLFRSTTSSPAADSPKDAYTCRNCQGQDASVAWDTASLLRDENRGLKQRVGELEAALDEALDAVYGVELAVYGVKS